MNVADLVKALDAAPEKRLRIIELAWELADERGELRPDRALAMADEVARALDEARKYVEASRKMQQALAGCLGD